MAADDPVVVARHPLDAAVSLYHQSENIDRRRLAELIGNAPTPTSAARLPVQQWLEQWVDAGADADPIQDLDSLAGVAWHLSDAWQRRRRDNVVLVHYDDLLADLDGQMRKLAERHCIDVAPHRWPDLVEAATLRQMRTRADQLAPDTLNVLRDRAAFFRRGSSGAGRELLGDEALRRYEQRITSLVADPVLLRWLHSGQLG